MPSSSGNAGTPGEALRIALDGAGGASLGRPAGRYAKSTSARVRALVKTGKGYGFLRATGLNPRVADLVRWLSGDQPTPATTRKINRAYDDYYQSRGKLTRDIPEWVKTGKTKITGDIETEPGYPRNRTLVIRNSKGKWQDITSSYVRGDDPDTLWATFVSGVIKRDIAFSTLDFPGHDYTIEFTS